VTSDTLYYTDWWKNTMAKYRVHKSELHMELYLYILQSFCITRENIIGVYLGAKFMIAKKTREIVLLFLILALKILIVENAGT